MSNNMVYPAQVETQSLGKLQVNVSSILGFRPISDATISISYTGEPNSTIEELRTDNLGQTEIIELATPPIDYSMEPSTEQPYAEYTIKITAPGFESINVNGAELLPNVTALQEAKLTPVDEAMGEESALYVIGPHTLFGDYPPKIAEEEIKPVNETGEIVLSRVVIPEFVVVHDGPPTDNSAKNYYIKFKDYIKNVASSEIYATWPLSTINANVLAILSFTLNRVYTEWYRKQYFFWSKIHPN